MKHLILLFFLLISIHIFSQETTKEGSVETEQMAEFPDGGSTNFRKLIVDNFRMPKIKPSENIACEVTFVIERDGSVSNIKSKGTNENFNKEAIRAVSRIKTKWIPGTINGQPVRSRFKIPLNITFN